jgi:NAD(P)-dependent dehydrogenase (short-subunit alcohol dehydrogenase family)
VHNNAGIVSGQPGWPESSLARLKQVLDINIGSVVFGTRLAVEHMRDAGGCIVNTASAGSFCTLAEDPVYAASQAAVSVFTRSCARLAETLRIRVNAVCPGLVDTPLLAKTGDGTTPAPWVQPYLRELELLRPEEVARAVIALVEDDSRAGECVVLDNRRRAHPR